MNILILNWRDIRNPQAGGAEVLTHQIAKRWVKWGNKVTQISAGYPDGKSRETIDGVEIIRLGRWWNVHFLAFWYYLLYFRKRTDAIIDEVHWFPFFTRLYAKEKTILLVCEVANSLFYQVFPYPVAIWGRAVEKFYLWLYKNTPTLAISPSTKQDLIKEGFKENKITILPMGVNLVSDIEKYRRIPKEKIPTLIYLGRINKQKGAEDILKAFKLVKEKIPDTRLWIVGAGGERYIQNYKFKIKNYKLQNSVKLFGYVSEEKKFELLAKAHILVVPSVHEGWGLVVPEAGSVGTPAVVYNVAGLRDVVKQGVNGILNRPDPKDLSSVLINLFKDKKQLKKLSRGAITEAERYKWDNTAKISLYYIKKWMKDNA